MSAPLRFIGVDRHGRGRAGSTRTGEVAAFVEKQYDRGWRDLQVLDGARVLGEIAQPKGAGTRRIWWAERTS